METKKLLLKELMPTKSNIDVVAQNILQPINDGIMDKHEVLVRGKFIIECINKALKQIEVTESTTYLGSKIEVVEAGTKYNYSENELWSELENEKEPIIKAQKELEELIKIATKKGVAISNPETGETILPVLKTSTTSLKITLGK